MRLNLGAVTPVDGENDVFEKGHADLSFGSAHPHPPLPKVELMSWLLSPASQA